MRSVTTRVVRSTLLSLALLLSLLLRAASAPASASGLLRALDPNLPVHPLLQYLEQTAQTGRVRLIVQKSGPLVSSLSIADAVGGLVADDFPFIQAMALDLPATTAPLLAHVPGVKYVTIDGPVRPLAVDTTHLLSTNEAAINVPSGRSKR